MSEDLHATTTTELTGEVLHSAGGVVISTTGLPAGSTITITITIGPGTPAPATAVATPAAVHPDRCPRCDLDLTLLPDRPAQCPRCQHPLEA